ncbi:MAG: outer membrane beta-barrel protein [Sphingobacteriales bacterium]|nr:outer membrane beta-barrel protein [Sphingobacteriales bacterium]MBI3719854.1 outer membrane beta-barrel protein [Sphingobacteriales bacterium]
MKKLLVLMMALLVSGAIMAQKAEVKKEARHFLALRAGPSIPVGEFGGSTIGQSNFIIADKGSGFAKTGFTIDVLYGYKIDKSFGISAALFYNNHGLKNKAIKSEMEKYLDVPAGTLSSMSLNHWQWYGISAGPMLTEKLSGNVSLNFNVMGGVAYVNSPRIKVVDQFEIAEDWTTAPLFRGGANFQFRLNDQLHLMVGGDYMYMQPRFTLSATVDNETISEKGKQNMAVVI